MATGDAIATTRVVRKQYECYPYPHRHPADEANRTLFTIPDDLATLNHYCFRGRRDFRTGFRALVAGGGTGDATIFLAEQLRWVKATLVHLDLSSTSIEIARQRAKVRGLSNVVWMQESLLDLPKLGLEPFDYINCSGVLHHLDKPLEGLKALRAVLKENGALGLMLYGKHGRTGVYQMQELMRLVNRNQPDPTAMVSNTRQVIELLPNTNWYKKSDSRIDPGQKDTDLFDKFLHSTDQPFTAADLHELLRDAGLHFVDFISETRSLYDPRIAFRDPEILKRIQRLPLPQQQSAAELFWGVITKHEFWASAETNTVANFSDPENVPFFTRTARRKGIPESLRNCCNEAWSTTIQRAAGIKLRIHVPMDSLSRRFIELIDDQRTTGQIVNAVVAGAESAPTFEQAASACRKVFAILQNQDLLLLRHASIPPMSTSDAHG